MRKQCCTCDRKLPITAFSKRSGRPSGVQSECKVCRAERRKANPEAYRVYVKKSKGKNKDKVNSQSRRYMFLRNLEKLYGLTEEAYESLREAQANRCAICNELFTKTPHVDHCHATGEVRGLLCGGCNRGLGHFKDEVVRLRAAIKYLKRGSKPQK